MMTRRKKILFLLLGSLLLLSGCADLRSLLQEPSPTPPPPTPTQTPLPPPPLDPGAAAEIDRAELDVAELRVIGVYERVAPSVVNVTTEVLRRGFFFEVIPEEGTGSGFVLDEDGHILTNYHVVDGARNVEVELEEGRIYTAEIVGLDPRTDLAVLRIDAPAEELHPVELGESTDLRVGQRAIAIGNPFGQFSRTLTTGVISAINRTLEGRDGRPISGVIQTDAAINRGNSGGPLLDSAGRVIGINTAIFSPTGTSAGVGFAVPVDIIRRVLPDLMSLGRYRHPHLGVRYSYRVTPGLAQTLSLGREDGLLLVQLEPGSPLEQAGILGAQSEAILGNRRVYLGGDILFSLDGKPISSSEELDLLLFDYSVGDRVVVSLQRGEEIIEVEVVLEEEERR